MRNTRTWVMLGVAVVSGLLAVFLASRWLASRSAGDGSRIAVASVDISLGQRLTPEMVKMVEWPAGSTPPGAVKEPAKLEGRVLRASLLKGEPVLEAKLSPVGTTGGLSAVIGEGRRAITVRVNDVIGVAGFALPGNYVDIIVNTQKEGEKRNDKDANISKIVLERILVLAVAQEVSRDETKPRVVNAVTLEVTPEQAEKLDLARSVGTLSLVLRNQVDPQPAATAGATKATLLDEPAPEIIRTTAPVKPVAAKRSVRKPAPAPAAAAPTQPAPVAEAPDNQACVGVINGLRNSKECY